MGGGVGGGAAVAGALVRWGGLLSPAAGDGNDDGDGDGDKQGGGADADGALFCVLGVVEPGGAGAGGASGHVGVLCVHTAAASGAGAAAGAAAAAAGATESGERQEGSTAAAAATAAAAVEVAASERGEDADADAEPSASSLRLAAGRTTLTPFEALAARRAAAAIAGIFAAASAWAYVQSHHTCMRLNQGRSFTHDNTFSLNLRIDRGKHVLFIGCER